MALEDANSPTCISLSYLRSSANSFSMTPTLEQTTEGKIKDLSLIKFKTLGNLKLHSVHNFLTSHQTEAESGAFIQLFIQRTFCLFSEK